jgi:thiol-disulfide isomerase/thioredoxin
MALTPSNMLALGTKAPDFLLPDTVSDKKFTLQDFSTATATVVMFLCNHCPYVIHVLPEIKKMSDDYAQKGIKFVAISSNDIAAQPDDAPDKMKALALQEKWSFPYLYDASQTTAKDYDATCTPDFYIFDKNLRLAYRGRLDNSRPSNGIVLSGKDIRNALDSLLADREVSPVQFPSMGCNIKWK